MRNHRRERGSSSLSSLFWMLVVAAAGYFGFMFAPIYFEEYEVKQVLRDVAASAWKGGSDDELRERVLEKCKRVGSHHEIRDGEEREIPGIVLLADDVSIRRNEQAKKLVIQAKYTKYVNYPFTKRQRVMRFSPSVKADLTPVEW